MSARVMASEPQAGHINVMVDTVAGAQDRDTQESALRAQEKRQSERHSSVIRRKSAAPLTGSCRKSSTVSRTKKQDD